ncbi:hypothetical protein FOZ62_022228 [Perkinsus olseni]|uniref:MYND-type domain-containing protein n=1 Tax=Perkinsus olseni TaxID=32597 RepID=A0A7J6R5R6_PEROL|nr:hypothetical protein FOZ62_022228 [Perkinsus olseni]
MAPTAISCQPLDPTVSNWTYYYPFANTPLRDLCASSRGADKSLPTRGLLLGCSDLSSVAHTLYLNQVSKTCGSDAAWQDTPIHAVCCDVEPAVIARSLVYLELLSSAGAELSTKTVTVAWEMVYSVFITPQCSAFLSKAIDRVLERLKSERSSGRALFLTGDRQAVVDILEWWSALLRDECVGDDIARKVQNVRLSWFKKTGGFLRGSTDAGMFVMWPDMIAATQFNGDNTFENYVHSYREVGYAGVSSVASSNGDSALSPAKGACRTVVNPTFFADPCQFRRAIETALSTSATTETIAEVWRVQVYMNPYMCIPGNLRKFMQETHFSKARYIRAPEGKGATPLQWAFELFGQRSAALVAALNGDVDHRIVLHCGDAFALCDALLPEPRAWLPSEVPKVEELARDLGRAEVPHKFDIIDTSNLADYSMFLPLLIAAGPLLADRSDNDRATLATDLMSPKGDSYEDLFRRHLCEVPLWLIPLACGLQVDFMHAENSHDSAARSDLSRLWTAYPQSTVSISAAILSPGMFGATPVRWRRCQSTFERISINHSAELKAAIVSFIGGCSRSLRDSPCGISTCVRFLDMLATSGSLVDVRELCGLLAEVAQAGNARLLTPALKSLLPLHGLSSTQSVFFREVHLVSDSKCPSERNTDLKSSMLPDVRIPEAVLHSTTDKAVNFSVCSVSKDGFRLLVPDDLKIGTASVRLLPFKSMRNRAGDLIEVPATITTVPDGGPRANGRPPVKQEAPSESEEGLSFTAREWLLNGTMHFVMKVNDEKRRAALERREKVEVKLLPDQPWAVVITTSAVKLATLFLPVAVSLDDIVVKVGRTSGTLDVSIPVAQCSPLGRATPLPRAILDGSSDAHVGPLPRATDEVLGSLSAPGGWLNLDLYSRSIPLPIRASQAWGMYKLRETLNAQYGHSRVLGDRVHGKYWGGRGPVLLRAKDGSPDVLVLLSADVRYDWTYGLLVNGAACVLTEDVMKKANAEIFGSLPLQIRPESLDPGSGEASLWRDQYLAAAAELARVTRGLSGTPKCVCGSDEDHGRNCKRAQKFWLTWLGGSRLPTSPRGMSYFSPIVLFPLYSPLTKLSHVSPWGNLQNPTVVRNVPSATISAGGPARDKRRCQTCGGAGTLLCSRCKNVYYCSVKCQRQDWKLHKKTCA